LLLVVHSLNDLHGVATVSTKKLAEYAGIPFPTAAKTLKSLSAAGITATKEGAGGGNALAKPISQITLLDIFMAIEQDAPLFKLHAGINCDHSNIDCLRERVEVCIGRAANAMKDSLKGVTLENIWAGNLPFFRAKKPRRQK